MKHIVCLIAGVLMASVALANGKPQESARIRTELAAEYFALGKFAIALDEVRLALAAEPEYAQAFNVRGLVYMRLKQDSQAEDSFRQALQIDPKDSDINNNFGYFLCERGRIEESLSYFNRALANPLYAKPETSYINAGRCQRRLGRLDEALRLYLAALKASPGNPAAWYGMAEVFFAKGNFAAARQYLDRYNQVTRPTAESAWLNVRVARRMNDRAGEQEWAKLLRQDFADSSEAVLLLTEQYE